MGWERKKKTKKGNFFFENLKFGKYRSYFLGFNHVQLMN